MTSTTSTWDAKKKRLDALKRAEQPFTICEDHAVRERRTRAKAIHQKAQDALENLPAEAEQERKLFEERVKTTKAELAAAQKAFDAVAVTLTFTALERQEFEDLQKLHKPSEEEEADGQDFALETFAPALISAASLDGMPVEDARRYLNTWSNADASGLWNAAWSVQHRQRTDLGKG